MPLLAHDVGEELGYVEYTNELLNLCKASECIGYVEYTEEAEPQVTSEMIGYVEYTGDPAGAYTDDIPSAGELIGYVEYIDENDGYGEVSEFIGYVEYEENPAGADVQYPITQSADDIAVTLDEFGAIAVWDPTAGDLLVANKDLSSFDECPLRFLDIRVPPGAIIIDSYLEVVVSNYAGDDSMDEYINVFAEDVDSAAAFAEVDYLARKANKTSEEKHFFSPADSWDAGGPGTVKYITGLAAIIQEIVNRPGWASGNNIALYLEYYGNPLITGEERWFASFDDGYFNPPILHIRYTESSAGQKTSEMMGYIEYIVYPEYTLASELIGYVEYIGDAAGSFTNDIPSAGELIGYVEFSYTPLAPVTLRYMVTVV